MPPRWSFFVRAEELRGRALGPGRRLRQLDQPRHGGRLDSDGEPDRDQVQHDREAQPPVRRARHVRAHHEDQQHAGDALDDRARDDDLALDDVGDDRSEVAVLRRLRAPGSRSAGTRTTGRTR